MWKQVAICMLCVLVCGCGFRPLYGTAEQDEVLQGAATVAVAPVSGEGGYQLGLLLTTKLNPQQLETAKAYRLAVQIEPVRYTNQSVRTDNFASLEQMTVSLKYQLIDLKTNQNVISSSVKTNGLLSIINQPYATTVAKEKLYYDLLNNLGNDIALHVLSYFKGKQP